MWRKRQMSGPRRRSTTIPPNTSVRDYRDTATGRSSGPRRVALQPLWRCSRGVGVGRFAMHRLIAGIVLLTALSATAKTYTDKATKLRFPDKLGSWEKNEVHHYDEPGAGSS